MMQNECYEVGNANRAPNRASRMTPGDTRGPVSAAAAREAGAGSHPDWLALVSGVREGHPVALAKLTGLITGLLARQGAYRLRDSWEDICQDVLAALVRSVEEGRLREPRAFVGFARVLVRNHVLDFVQRRQRITSGGRRDETSLREPLDASHDLASPSESPELRMDLDRGLASLSAKCRLVIEEIYLRGRTYQEASDRLGIPLGTVKRLQTQGLRVLRDVLVGRSEDRGESAGGSPTPLWEAATVSL